MSWTDSLFWVGLSWVPLVCVLIALWRWTTRERKRLLARPNLDEPMREEVRSHGWNSLDPGSGNAHVFAQQLSYIGVLLWDIREELRKSTPK